MADPVIYEAVVFDLDGTLLDTLDDLADSMNVALQQMDFPTHPTEKYRYFVGDGMRQLARRVLPTDKIDESTVDTMVKIMSVEYDKRWNAKQNPIRELRKCWIR